MAPTRTQRRWPDGSTSAWMGMEASAPTPNEASNGPRSSSERSQRMGPGRSREHHASSAFARLESSILNSSKVTGSPSRENPSSQRRRSAISSTQGAHQVAHRLSQSHPLGDAGTSSRPAKGRSAGGTYDRARSPLAG